jgi:CubicO group peptidase (beta-lactamase class C family)
MRRYLLPFAISITLIVHLNANGQTISETQQKINLVESNLVGPVQIAGETPGTIIDRMAHFNTIGLSIAVIKDYKIIWAKGYGLSDKALKIPVTPHTLFQAASMSKSVNAMGVLKLVQSKKLDLYTDINGYLKSWKFSYDSLSKNKKITIANLLSHTAGLSGHGFGGYEKSEKLPSVKEILDGTKPANSDPVRSMYEPGLKSEYSGGGIMISQLIVMDVTHMPYDEYMLKNVLEPLGMTSSTFKQPPIVKPQLLATAYDESLKELPGKFHIYPEQAAAGLWTTPTELAKFVIELQLAYEGKSAKVLNQSMAKAMLTPYHNNNTALGVFIDSLGENTYFEHGGANEGFRSQYYGSLTGGNGVIVMVNSNNNDILNEVINSVAKVYGFKGLYRSATKKLITLPDSTLQSYTGDYALSPQLTLTVFREGNQLFTQPTGQPRFAIFPESPNKFFVKSILVDLEFIKDKSGKITEAIIYQNGKEFEAKKIYK